MMEKALEKMAEYGLNPGELLQTGKIERFGHGTSKHDKPCWYVCNVYNDSIYVSFGDWSSGLSEKYSDYGSGKTEKEIIQIKKEFERIKRETEQLREQEAGQASIKATDMWSGMKEGTHPYLTKKQIKQHGSRRYKESLVIPVYKNKKIISLQFISSAGKRFLSGGITSGGAYVITGENKTVVVCEGFATGASINEATGYQVFISFYANNLPKVAEKVRELLPESKIIIACDNDKYKDPDKNPGVEYGHVAANKINGIIVVPEFKDDTTKPTDFNDVHVLDGIESVKKQIKQPADDFEEKLKQWCMRFNGTFNVTEIHNHFSIKTKDQKDSVDEILLNLCKEKIIEKDSKKRYAFRVVDKKIKTMTVKKQKQVYGVNISLPFGLEKDVVIEDRNLIVIAGESNSGKTAIMFQNMIDNILTSSQFCNPVYISSEMSESEFSNRALLLNEDPELWNQAEIIDKSNNFHDAISDGRDNKLVYIDLLETSKDVAFCDMEAVLKQIRDSLNGGVAVVAMQKNKGQALAKGGEGTKSKARLYISLHHCYKGQDGIINRAVIEKCKMVHSGSKNPEGKNLFYKITSTGGVRAITEWIWVNDVDMLLNRMKTVNPEVGNGLYEVDFKDEYKEAF